MARRNITVALECYIKKGNKYLMLHRNLDKKIMPGVWMAPGGKREFNEGLIECARREIMEETALKIKNIKLKVVGNSYLKDLNEELYFSWLLADYCGGTLTNGGKDGEFKWLTVKEISKLDNLLAELKEMIPYLFDNTNKVYSIKSVFEKGNKMIEFKIERP